MTAFDSPRGLSSLISRLSIQFTASHAIWPANMSSTSASRVLHIRVAYVMHSAWGTSASQAQSKDSGSLGFCRLSQDCRLQRAIKEKYVVNMCQGQRGQRWIIHDWTVTTQRCLDAILRSGPHSREVIGGGRSGTSPALACNHEPAPLFASTVIPSHITILLIPFHIFFRLIKATTSRAD